MIREANKAAEQEAADRLPSDDTGIESSDIAPPTVPQATPLPLKHVYLPDSEGVLGLASQLVFDDAPWISQSLRRARGDRKVSVRFLHSRISVDDAQLLGARSLRDHLFAGDKMVCPDADYVKTVVGADGVLDVLKDLFSLSDGLLKGRSLHLVYDERTHPVESLMHHGLASVQGPALIAYIEGPVLTSEAMSQLLSNISSLSALPTQDTINRLGLEGELAMYPKIGKRLLSAFAITDCLQMISGRELFLFDPLGQHLATTDLPTGVNSTADTKRNKARGQKSILLNDKKTQAGEEAEQGILGKFPDQFSGFMSLPFGLQSNMQTNGFFRGALIRMPLRTAASALGGVTSPDEIKRALRAFKDCVAASLLTASTLLTAAVYHRPALVSEGDAEVTLDYQVSLYVLINW